MSNKSVMLCVTAMSSALLSACVAEDMTSEQSGEVTIEADARDDVGEDELATTEEAAAIAAASASCTALPFSSCTTNAIPAHPTRHRIYVGPQDSWSRIEVFDRAARSLRVPLTCTESSPIRFVPVGDERAAVDLATGLLNRGYFVNVAYFPAVPRRRAGVRLMLNAHQTLEDIQGLVAAFADCLRLDRPALRPPPSAPSWSVAEPA